MKIDKLKQWYKEYHKKTLKGQYVTYERIEPLLNELPAIFKTEILGHSVLGRPIKSVTIGSGKTRILLWSQMHGDESTATRVLFDVFEFFKQPTTAFKPICDVLLTNCTLVFVPILNPDGAAAYTRENALNIDLNRDAKSLQMPESIVLKTITSYFKPHFAFNLHDQSTKYNVSGTKNPSTLSFLAPAADVNRSITPSRKKAMQVIAEMNSFVQKIIPNHVALYDDEFCNTCFGDTLQQMGVPLMLIEAGHSDWKREKTREYYFYALLKGLESIATKHYKTATTKQYFEIPRNNTLFYDVIYRNVLVKFNKFSYVIDIAINFDEYISDDKVLRKGKIAKIGDLSPYLAHIEEDVYKAEYNNDNKLPKIGDSADFFLADIEITNGLTKKMKNHFI